MKNEVFKKANEFIYRNARPLDLALWRYHFDVRANMLYLKDLKLISDLEQ